MRFEQLKWVSVGTSAQRGRTEPQELSSNPHSQLRDPGRPTNVVNSPTRCLPFRGDLFQLKSHSIRAVQPREGITTNSSHVVLLRDARRHRHRPGRHGRTLHGRCQARQEPSGEGASIHGRRVSQGSSDCEAQGWQEARAHGDQGAVYRHDR